ncbi:TetR-like C-terminal domain-containing protein [Mycolicibacterium duvalii]|uniref:Putative transcriptional regulator, TetR family protein n=1 Tax=Mycolicibacterium duvalii TaxID=39688 RepID=A0A7I7K4I3_9MYCO|nr:TetR-like C-terminal domain-containing protein [Mycolicibacterium duvalii]BBX18361.1 putative transcriptional regulator, TetR family protein [Mycolicibacterium duvalii]
MTLIGLGSDVVEDAVAREKALDAALAELQQWGVDRFSIQGVALRTGLDPDFLHAQWDGEQQLIIDALSSYSQMMITPPDTGSLHGDLTELALALAGYLNEPVGRRIARMLVIDSKSLVVDSDTRIAFYATRREVIEVIFRRAADRGELRDDVKPIVALQLLTSPLHTFALYRDAPVDPAYCRAVADLVTRAIAAG